MMPLDEITKSIEASAKGEAESIRDDAASEVKRILNEASADAKSIERDYAEQAAAEIMRMRQDADAEVKRAAQVTMLEATDESVRREVKKVLDTLEGKLMRSQHYGTLFKKAMKKAKEIAKAEDLVVQVSKRDEHFVKGFGAKIVHANIKGLIIKSGDGNVTINATLGQLIDASMEDIRKGVMSEIRKNFGNIGAAAKGAKAHKGMRKSKAHASKKPAKRPVHKKTSRKNSQRAKYRRTRK